MDSSLLGSWICLASLRDVPRPGHEKIALDSISIADSDLPVVPIGRSQPALIVSTNHPRNRKGAGNARCISRTHGPMCN